MNKYLKYTAIPFVDRGRSFEGADCWGLVALIYKTELSIELPSYGAISSKDLLSVAKAMKDGKDFGDWVAVDQQKEFDVIVMSGRVGHEKLAIHVGIAVDENKIIHTEQGVNVVVVDRNHYQVKNRIIGTYRYYGI